MAQQGKLNAVDALKDVKGANSETDAQAELATAIDELLETVGSKFQQMSKDILTQMDAMSRRLDDLEAQAKANANNNDSSTS